MLNSDRVCSSLEVIGEPIKTIKGYVQGPTYLQAYLAIYQVRDFSKLYKYFHGVPIFFSLGSILCINAFTMECFDSNRKPLKASL